MVINKLINVICLEGSEGVNITKIMRQELLAIYPYQMSSTYDRINMNIDVT